jgi:adenine-specific DNA-methyltransferase
MIIFDPADIDTAIETIQQLYPGKKKRGTKPRCKVYIFSPGHYAYDEEFDPVIDKIELCALPEAIYQAYKAVLPKARRKFLEELEQGVQNNE